MTDLPIETELIDGGIYFAWDGQYLWWDGLHKTFRELVPKAPVTYKGALARVEPVAEYRPAPAEPTGLGAVVKDANGHFYIRADKKPHVASWLKCGSDRWRFWEGMDQPVEVLSEGVTL